MKLIRIAFDHVSLFEDGKFQIDFFAQDKVPAEDETVTPLGPSLYTNNVLAFAGINASGKTTALQLISLALSIVEGAPLISYSFSSGLLDLLEEPLHFTATFWDNGRLLLLESTLGIAYGSLTLETGHGELVFEEEALFEYSGRITKTILAENGSSLSKKCTEVLRRSQLDQASQRFLPENVSIAKSIVQDPVPFILQKAHDEPIMLGSWTGDVSDVLRAFDSTIEYLRPVEGRELFELKFSHDAPRLLSRQNLAEVLSSGTIRGLELVLPAIQALSSGGYFLLDEIENHLNKQLVQMIIELFAQRESNPRGATLVFTTHYPEILDCLHRKDCVYFLARKADGRTEVAKYSDRISRIENKKSEVFISNYIKGTAPRFTDVRALKQYALQAIRQTDE